MVRPQVEIVCPREEGFHLCPSVREQLRVHSEPGREGDPAV